MADRPEMCEDPVEIPLYAHGSVKTTCSRAKHASHETHLNSQEIRAVDGRRAVVTFRWENER